MEYYEDNSSDIPKGIINLEYCIRVHSGVRHIKYKNVIKIDTLLREYFLVCGNETEMNEWMEALSNLCGEGVNKGNGIYSNINHRSL